MDRGSPEILGRKVNHNHSFPTYLHKGLYHDDAYFVPAELIPGTFYGVDKGEKFHRKIAVDKSVVLREMRHRGIELENTLYKVTLPGGETHLAVARSTQIHPGILKGIEDI